MTDPHKPANAGSPRVIVALDYASREQAIGMLDRLDPEQCRVKIGKELFTRFGPAMVEAATERGFDVFLDLKYHDIPNTVAAACDAAADLGVWMVNLHASGGRAMMRAARERLAERPDPPLLIAVTVLTSMNAEELNTLECRGSPRERVLLLAGIAAEAGLDGVVCSAREAEALREKMPQGFLLVTPGIRPPDASRDDQQRIATPEAALKAGSDYLVIGRPITAQADPLGSLEKIRAMIGEA